MGAANERAADIFMDSGILNSLQKMSNVKSFEFLFDMMTYHFDNDLPKPRHMKMIQDLQRFIERNWQVEQASNNTLSLSLRMLLSRGEAPEQSRTK